MFENNAICKLLNIKYPIFQGGMAWIGTASSLRPSQMPAASASSVPANAA